MLVQPKTVALPRRVTCRLTDAVLTIGATLVRPLELAATGAEPWPRQLSQRLGSRCILLLGVTGMEVFGRRTLCRVGSGGYFVSVYRVAHSWSTVQV